MTNEAPRRLQWQPVSEDEYTTPDHKWAVRRERRESYTVRFRDVAVTFTPEEAASLKRKLENAVDTMLFHSPEMAVRVSVEVAKRVAGLLGNAVEFTTNLRGPHCHSEEWKDGDVAVEVSWAQWCLFKNGEQWGLFEYEDSVEDYPCFDNAEWAMGYLDWSHDDDEDEEGEEAA